MVSGESSVLQIAVSAFIALAGGIFFSRLKQPSILAYVLTGIIVGPSGLGLIESRAQVSLFAELGVLLLLFVIGMELNVQTFKKHIMTSSLCVILQIVFGLTVSSFLSLFFHWPIYFTVALGFVAALSSTAVVMNILEGMNMRRAHVSSLILGILIAQDIAVIPMILTLQALTQGAHDWTLFAKIIAALGFMAILISYLTNRPSFNFSPAKIFGQDKDLYMLAGLSICFLSAAIAGGIGVTAPYGAFIAGLTIGNLSGHNNLFVESIQPIQKLLLMVFFLSIGILLDLHFVWQHIFLISVLLIVFTFIKTLANIYILKLLKVRFPQAIFTGISLAQLGEFAFLLTTILDHQRGAESFAFAQKCLIALTVLSLAISPLWIQLGRRMTYLFKREERLSSHTMVRYTFVHAWRRIKADVAKVYHMRFSQKTIMKSRKLQVKFGHRAILAVKSDSVMESEQSPELNTELNAVRDSGQTSVSEAENHDEAKNG